MSVQDSRPRKPARRGFAAMDKERQREIARKGGASVPDDKRSFSQDRDLAASAGRKGGEVVSNDKQHMKEIGRMGGRAKRRKRGETVTTAAE